MNSGRFRIGDVVRVRGETTWQDGVKSMNYSGWVERVLHQDWGAAFLSARHVVIDVSTRGIDQIKTDFTDGLVGTVSGNDMSWWSAGIFELMPRPREEGYL